MKTLKETTLGNLKKRHNREFYVGTDGMIRDSLCDTKEFKAIEKEVDKAVEEQMKNEGFEYPCFGGCHKFWAIKKQILKSEHNIDWLSPSELNPFVMFD